MKTAHVEERIPAVRYFTFVKAYAIALSFLVNWLFL